MQNRNIALVIVFSLISCGIYMFYWIYVTARALEDEGQTGGLDATIILILSIFVSSVGFLLFGMYADANLNAIKARRGAPISDNKVLWIILGLLIPIVLVGLVQYEINTLCPEA